MGVLSIFRGGERGEGKGKREKGGGGKKNKLLGLSLIFEKVKILEQLLELKKEL